MTFSFANRIGDRLGMGTLLILPLEVGLPGDGLSIVSGRNDGSTMVNPPVSSSDNLVA